MPRSFFRLVLAALLLASFAGPAVAGKAQLFLSWHAPFGYPRASDSISMTSGDTTRTDTLYLSFDPGQDDSTFIAMSATINIRCATGDTLGSYWRMGPPNKPLVAPRNPRVEFNYGDYWPYPAPWAVQGFGSSAWDWTREAGRLRMIYTVGPQQGAPVDSGKAYVLARAIFRHPPATAVNSRKPLCFEWAITTLAYSTIDAPDEVHTGEHRWVSLNSPNGAVCRDYLRLTRSAPAVWEPNAKKP